MSNIQSLKTQHAVFLIIQNRQYILNFDSKKKKRKKERKKETKLHRREKEHRGKA